MLYNVQRFTEKVKRTNLQKHKKQDMQEMKTFPKEIIFVFCIEFQGINSKIFEIISKFILG